MINKLSKQPTTNNKQQTTNNKQMGSTMSAQQKDNFITQSTKFHSNKSLSYCVKLWQEGENNNMIYNETVTPVGTLPHTHNLGGMPVFQKEVQEGWDVVKVKTPKDGGTLVMKTDGEIPCMAFMPAGFRDGPTPNKINPFREEIGNPVGNTPQKCAASLCHVVTIPIDIRRYNVISCDKSDIDLLNTLDRIGKEACVKLIESDDSVIGSLRWHMKQDSTITMKDERIVNTKILDTDFMDSSVYTMAQSDGIQPVMKVILDSIKTTFHVGESASVGYIHSHTRPTCFDLTSRGAMDELAEQSGYLKETLIEDVLECVQSEEYYNLVNGLDQSEEEDDSLVRTRTVLVPQPEPEPANEDDSLTRQKSAPPAIK